MTRHLLIFAACFLLGAAITAAVRTARHHPYAGHEGPHRMAPPSAVGMPAAETHASHGAGASTPPAIDPPSPQATDAMPDVAAHTGHGGEAVAPAAVPPPAHGAVVGETAADKPVNTICAVCGMPVDPQQPTSRYRGKTIGFGCKACPPKVAADPDLYGPAALQNSVVEE